MKVISYNLQKHRAAS
ncbi:hypothetical protein, partial [Microbacterium sp.]